MEVSMEHGIRQSLSEAVPTGAEGPRGSHGLIASTAGPERPRVISRIARQLGIGKETLRIWVQQADVGAGHKRFIGN